MPYGPGNPATSHLADPFPLIIQDLLVNALSLGVAPPASGSWPVYLGSLPDSPDDLIFIKETTPVSQGRYMEGAHVRAYAASVTVRSNNYTKGDTRIRLISRNLTEPTHGLTFPLTRASPTSGNYLIHNVSIASGPFHVGLESPQSKREVFALNILSTIDWFKP